MEAFEIGSRVLGRGEYGTVLLGTERSTRRKVAIKRLHRTDRAMFTRREIGLLSRLRHENVIAMLHSDMVADDAQAHPSHIVFEYAPIDLERQIFCRPSEPVAIDSCMEQLLRGLAYIHSQGVVHRVSSRAPLLPLLAAAG